MTPKFQVCNPHRMVCTNTGKELMPLKETATPEYWHPQNSNPVQSFKPTHDAQVVSTGSYFVVLEFGVQGAEIKFMFDQIVQCKGEAAGR
jgi:hypothetical protein